MTTFVNLQQYGYEVLSEGFVNTVLDQDIITNTEAPRLSVHYLGIKMAVRKDRTNESTDTESPKTSKTVTILKDDISQTVIEKDIVTGVNRVNGFVLDSHICSKDENALYCEDLVWQKLMKDLKADGVESKVDNSVMPDIVPMSDTNGIQCDINNLSACQSTMGSPSFTTGVENAVRKLRVSIERNISTNGCNREESIRKLRNTRVEEVNLDKMHGQVEFAFGDRFEHMSGSRVCVRKQESHKNDVACEFTRTINSTSLNYINRIDTYPRMSSQSSGPKSENCSFSTPSSSVSSTSSLKPCKEVGKCTESVCKDCLANEHETLIKKLERSSKSVCNDSKSRSRLSSRRSKKSISTSSTASADSSPKSPPHSPTDSACSSKSSVKTVHSPIHVLEESTSQSTQCSSNGMFSLMHPMNKIICNRLKQWKKRPKRKFKLSDLLSCARA